MERFTRIITYGRIRKPLRALGEEISRVFEEYAQELKDGEVKIQVDLKVRRTK